MKRILILFIVLFIGTAALADDITQLYKKNIEDAANQVVECWINEDKECFEHAYKKLVKYEAYLFVIEPDWEGYYLISTPAKLKKDAIGAYLFLLKQRRRGINLLNLRKFFEGKTFKVRRKTNAK